MPVDELLEAVREDAVDQAAECLEDALAGGEHSLPGLLNSRISEVWEDVPWQTLSTCTRDRRGSWLIHPCKLRSPTMLLDVVDPMCPIGDIPEPVVEAGVGEQARPLIV